MTTRSHPQTRPDYDDLAAEVQRLREELQTWRECGEALDGRLGLPNDQKRVRVACEEYVLAEDQLPDDFDGEDYRLSSAVGRLVTRVRELEAKLKSDDKYREAEKVLGKRMRLMMAYSRYEQERDEILSDDAGEGGERG